MKNRIKFLLFIAHTTTLSLFLATEMAIIGAGWLNPLTNSFDASTSFQLMERIAPDGVWGLVMLVTGLMQAYSLINQKRRMRRLWLSLATFLWMVIGLSLFVSNPPGSLWILFTHNALGCFFCQMRPLPVVKV